MRFGELVHSDGSLNVNTSNNAWKDLGACAYVAPVPSVFFCNTLLRHATTRPGEQMDVLVLAGQPEQEWAPLFVYHGFRFRV